MKNEESSQSKGFKIAKPGMLQLLLPLLLLIVATWIAIGRLFLGSGGWLIILTVLLAGPLMIAYIIAIWIILLVRYRRSAYVFSKLMKASIYILLVSGFILGLTIVDGGDTSSSVSSGLLSLLGLNGVENQGSIWWAVNSLLYFFSFIAASTSAILVLVLACIDKGKLHERT